MANENLSPKEAAKRDQLEDLKVVRAFKDLERTEGWKMFITILNTKLNNMGSELLDPLPLEGHNAAARNEHLKGTMYGLTMARDMVSTTIRGMEGVLDTSNPALGD